MVRKLPVVLFTFKRLETVQKIINVIRTYEPDCLYIFSDGARENVAGEFEKVDAVRNYIQDAVDWKCDKHFTFSEVNLGCDQNIRGGLDIVFAEQQYAIIFEDDAVPTIAFFHFCEKMLLKYKEDKRIQYIAGFNAIGDSNLISNDYSFGKTVPLNGAFATWKDRWNECDFDMKEWPNNRKKGILDDAFFYKELRKQWYKIYDEEYKKISTAWDYIFEHDMLSKNRLAIVPKHNLVTSYGYVEGAYHPQQKGEADRFKKYMTAKDDYQQDSLNETYEVIRNCEYDKLRQKKLLEIKGNYFKRRIDGAYRCIKDFVYIHVSEEHWKLLKHMVSAGKNK